MGGNSQWIRGLPTYYFNKSITISLLTSLLTAYITVMNFLAWSLLRSAC